MFNIKLIRYDRGTLNIESSDTLDQYITAEEYIRNFDGNLSINKVDNDILVKISDETGDVLSRAWVSKTLGLKFQAIDAAGHVLASSTENDRQKAIDALVKELSENESYSFWYDSYEDVIFTCEGEPNANAEDLDYLDIHKVIF